MEDLSQIKTISQLQARLGIKPADEKLSNVLSKAIRQIVADADKLLQLDFVRFNGRKWLRYDSSFERPGRSGPKGRCDVCLFGLAMLAGRCDSGGLEHFDAALEESWKDASLWVRNVCSEAINSIRAGDVKHAFECWYDVLLTEVLSTSSDAAHGCMLPLDKFDKEQLGSLVVYRQSYYIARYDAEARTKLLEVADGIQAAEAALADELKIADLEARMAEVISAHYE